MSRSSETSRSQPAEKKPSIALRDLVGALILAAIGALGALPGSRGSADPVALLTWLSMWALPAGIVAGASRGPLWPLGTVIPGLWMGVFGLVAAGSARVLPSPAWAALAWSGLFGVGFAIGRLFPRQCWRAMAVGLVTCAVLNALAIAGAWLASPLPPALSARLIDLAPATLLAECAGVDWMRHPSIYEPAGALDIDPSLRVAWRGMLAGPIVFLVGCVAAFAADRIAGRRGKSPPSTIPPDEPS